MKKKIALSIIFGACASIFFVRSQLVAQQLEGESQAVADISPSLENLKIEDVEGVNGADTLVETVAVSQDGQGDEVAVEAVESQEGQEVQPQPQEYIEDLDDEQMPELPGDVPPAVLKKERVGKPIKKLGAITPDEFNVEVLEGDFDESEKRQDVIDLVNRGVAFFNTHSVADACSKFTHTKDFQKGELYMFVFDLTGTVFAHGQQSDLLWKNLYEMRDQFGTPVVQAIINKAKEGGGWVTYTWRNAAKNSYVREVSKNGKSYAIGAGYYSHSKQDSVINLVEGAVDLFNKMIKDGWRVEDAFGLISYPKGRFIKGDLYLYALDFKGNHFAHGDRPGLIGSNAWDYADANGKLVNQEIIEKLKEAGHGVWVEYVSKNSLKKAYAKKVQDAQGNEYFIACGYYPEITRDNVFNLVKRGYQYVKTSGKAVTSRDFTDPQNNDYRDGDLYLSMYDMKGNIIADGDNRELIGKNYIDEKDENGKYYVRELIKKAQEDGEGWVNAKINNSFKSFYVEKIDLGTENLIITSGLYPVSKKETVEILAKSAADHLKSNEIEIAFHDFTALDGKFVRGDLQVFVLDTSGICYAYGDDYDLIWKNLMRVQDDNKKLFIKDIIDTAKSGFAKVSYMLSGEEKVAYVEAVEKDGVTYVVGSSFYL